MIESQKTKEGRIKTYCWIRAEESRNSPNISVPQFFRRDQCLQHAREAGFKEADIYVKNFYHLRISLYDLARGVLAQLVKFKTSEMLHEREEGSCFEITNTVILEAIKSIDAVAIYTGLNLLVQNIPGFENTSETLRGQVADLVYYRASLGVDPRLNLPRIYPDVIKHFIKKSLSTCPLPVS